MHDLSSIHLVSDACHGGASRRFATTVRRCPSKPLGAIFLALLLLATGPTPVRAEFIASYQGEGNAYTIFANELIAYLNAEGPEGFVLENRVTQGSVENIESLFGERDVVLAICQEDVARYFYTGAGNEFFYVSRADNYDITSLSRLFLEELYLVAQPEVEALDDIQTIYVGEPRSGTYATYTNLRRYHKPTWTEIRTGDHLQLFRDREIDAFLDIGSTPHRELMAFAQEQPGLQLLPLRRTDLSLGLDVYRTRAVPDSLSPTGTEFQTASVPAVLLARRDLPHQVARLILDVIHDRELRERWLPESEQYLDDIAFELNPQDGTPRATDLHFSNLPIPPHPSVVRLTLGRFPYTSFLLVLVGLVAIWIVWWQLPSRSERAHRSFRRTEKKRMFYRDVHFGFLAAVWVIVAATWIKYLEIAELVSGRTVSGSDFVEMDVGAMARWLFIFCTTGFEDNVFPLSPGGKILAVSVQVAGLALLTWVGARLISLLLSKLLERRGMQNYTDLSGHLVIFNWNQHGVRVLEELRSKELPKTKRRRTIVVVAPVEEGEVPKDDFENVHHLKSEAWDRTTLGKIGIDRAESVIILSPRSCGMDPELCDGLVYRTALSLKSYLSDNPPKQEGLHVVAQVSRPIDLTARDSLGIDESVASHEMGGRLLAQTVLCPGVTKFFDEILDNADDSNEVYSCTMPKELHGEPAKFWNVVEFYGDASRDEEPVLPVGLRLAPRENGGGDGSSALQNGVSVLLNPTADELRRIGVTEFVAEDQVLFLADGAAAAQNLSSRGA